MHKKKFMTAGAVLVVALVALALGLGNRFLSDSGLDTEQVSLGEPLKTVEVASVDFVQQTEIEGTLGFGSVNRLPNLASGIVTWLPEPGAYIDFGDVIYEIDGQPIVLIRGAVPMYRDIDITTAGELDVVQFQEHLVAEGFSDTHPITRSEYDLNEDRYVTDISTDEIKNWQESVGAVETGRVEKDQIVFRANPIRVDSVNVQLGQAVNGGSLIDVSETRRVVTARLETDLSGLLRERDLVEVVLPDGTIVQGTTTYVADTVTRTVEGQQEVTYLEAIIELSGEGTSFDQSPVTVKVKEVIEQDVLAVPTAALLALAEGGYAVEVAKPDGSTTLVGVKLGTFHENQVSISGQVSSGQLVIIP